MRTIKTAAVVVLAAWIGFATPVLAKKGGNGNGGGGGDDGGTTVPNAPGEIAVSDNDFTSEMSLDGTAYQPTLAPADADPSNLTFANGERWYLTTKVTRTLPMFEDGVQTDVVEWVDVFAVNSLTGQQIQLTDFAAAGWYVDYRSLTWARDGQDSYIACALFDESRYLVVVDGELGFEVTDYEYAPTPLVLIPYSSTAVDNAYRAGLPMPLITSTAATILPHAPVGSGGSGSYLAREFSVSADGVTGAYMTLDFIYRETVIFDVPTGATLAVIPDARDPSWSPDGSKLVFATRDTVNVFDTLSGVTTVLQTDIKREQSNFWNPEFSPDGNYILYSSQHPQGKDISFEAQVMNSDGSDRVQVDTRFREATRWVSD
ncbi:hypothetical protein NG895_18695 [Aeoliella sp. ICT_H6.2]|uniref:WD40 repeat protein n=1 Tax=Aeoliella straminimaris TaxID=2954799 RepID=A0A9X2FCY6_9BACT|nr:hypothetical protein [Aeoliella straminimaris]MCO6045933.1 hypothetical protein [Aeoliella straminimaris]